MSHVEQRRFVEEVRAVFPDHFERTRVLEVGSWDANGSVRSFFSGCHYVGCDVAAGAGVDMVAAGQHVDLPDNSFDVVISCECFEHNPSWAETFLNMGRMLRPGGLFILTCAGIGRAEHGTSRTNPSVSLTAIEQHADYYRNLSRRDFEFNIPMRALFAHYAFIDNRCAKDLYFVGIKTSEDWREDSGDAAIGEKIASIRKASSRIGRPGRHGWIRTISAHVEWWVKWGLVQLLCEPGYHDFRYALRQMTRAPKRVEKKLPFSL